MIQAHKFDYEKSIFKMICLRKHFLKDITYFLFLFEDYIILTQEVNSQQPKYIFKVNLQTKVYWQQEKQSFIQVGFEYKEDVKYFHGDSEELQKLKLLLRNKVMYRNVSDFYIPIKQLGRGGSSRVYLAKNKSSNQEFASKNVEKRYLREDGGFEALFNEINLMSVLSHENIVKLEEVYEGENTFYIILEYLKGSSLHEIIKKEPSQLRWDEIKSIMLLLLTAVDYMHSQNIMHRDLKPENIMFKNLNDVKEGLRIVDFGLATSTTVSLYPFPKCGTPGYVAPEIANLKDLTIKYDKICDIFSIGCIFYKLITTKDLFPGNDFHEILKLNKRCMINLDTLNIYQTPQTALDLINQMLQTNPKNRITANEALKHPFFLDSFQDRKLKFQSQKISQNNSIKPWQTLTFKLQKSDRIQLPQATQISQQNEDEEIEDEKTTIKFPTINSPRFVQQSQTKNLALAETSPTELPKKSALKKFSTQEFEQLTPDTQSPDSGRINFSSSPRIIQNGETKKQFTFSKYNQQQQAIYEVDDEQKL